MRSLSCLLLALLLCSCATPRPPTNAPLHSALPSRFELNYYYGIGGRSELTLENGYLIRRQYELKHNFPYKDKNVLTETEYFVPSEAQWVAFWKKMNQLRIWSWRKNYDPSDVGEIIYDGGGWKLTLAYQNRKIETGGENAGPNLQNPSATVVAFGEPWDKQLREATAILTRTEE